MVCKFNFNYLTEVAVNLGKGRAFNCTETRDQVGLWRQLHGALNGKESDGQKSSRRHGNPD